MTTMRGLWKKSHQFFTCGFVRKRDIIKQILVLNGRTVEGELYKENFVQVKVQS